MKKSISKILIIFLIISFSADPLLVLAENDIASSSAVENIENTQEATTNKENNLTSATTTQTSDLTQEQVTISSSENEQTQASTTQNVDEETNLKSSTSASSTQQTAIINEEQASSTPITDTQSTNATSTLTLNKIATTSTPILDLTDNTTTTTLQNILATSSQEQIISTSTPEIQATTSSELNINASSTVENNIATSSKTITNIASSSPTTTTESQATTTSTTNLNLDNIASSTAENNIATTSNEKIIDNNNEQNIQTTTTVEDQIATTSQEQTDNTLTLGEVTKEQEQELLKDAVEEELSPKELEELNGMGALSDEGPQELSEEELTDHLDSLEELDSPPEGYDGEEMGALSAIDDWKIIIGKDDYKENGQIGKGYLEENNTIIISSPNSTDLRSGYWQSFQPQKNDADYVNISGRVKLDKKNNNPINAGIYLSLDSDPKEYIGINFSTKNDIRCTNRIFINSTGEEWEVKPRYRWYRWWRRQWYKRGNRWRYYWRPYYYKYKINECRGDYYNKIFKSTYTSRIIGTDIDFKINILESGKLSIFLKNENGFSEEKTIELGKNNKIYQALLENKEKVKLEFFTQGLGAASILTVNDDIKIEEKNYPPKAKIFGPSEFLIPCRSYFNSAFLVEKDDDLIINNTTKKENYNCSGWRCRWYRWYRNWERINIDLTNSLAHIGGFPFSNYTKNIKLSLTDYIGRKTTKDVKVNVSRAYNKPLLSGSKEITIQEGELINKEIKVDSNSQIYRIRLRNAPHWLQAVYNPEKQVIELSGIAQEWNREIIIYVYAYSSSRGEFRFRVVESL